MARQTRKLTEEQCKSAWIDRKKAILGDGGGLYLRRFPTSYSWVFIWREDGKRREIGLGGYGNKVSLAEARKRADRATRHIAAGRDPADAMFKVRQLFYRTTFEQLVRIFVRKANRGTFSHKLRTDYCNMLLRCCKTIRNMKLSAIKDSHILHDLKNIKQNEKLVKFIKFRIGNVFRWGKWNGFQTSPDMASIVA
ncbi:Arm DNA-binding domain-containing protein [Mesorhizobium sp. RP14(2022)]|uniref:Arm DNA-binding domain-containing protein n=1 Tax=Mesorhizobium liriopis TaxID=2953882 RepID=A0ABT1C3G1_9HYPH|nr:Arm DNA-binding domain-containing protein [Mesorhizobium liriopis]